MRQPRSSNSVNAPDAVSLPGLNLKQNLEWTERETVRRALEGADGVKKDAAEAMGISQRAMSYYVAKHRLEDPVESMKPEPKGL